MPGPVPGAATAAATARAAEEAARSGVNPALYRVAPALGGVTCSSIGLGTYPVSYTHLTLPTNREV